MTNAFFLEENSILLQKTGDKQYDHCIRFIRCHVLTLTARKDPRGLTTIYPEDATRSSCNIEYVCIIHESGEFVVYSREFLVLLQSMASMEDHTGPGHLTESSGSESIFLWRYPGHEL